MSFCPKWVFEASCAAAATEYLSSHLDLNTVASGYAATLSEFYQPIAADELARAIEQMLRLLDELGAGEDAATIVIGFCYNKITFDQPNKPRKLKGIFGSADEPIKIREYSADGAFKSFKAYVYSLRNEVVELAPVGWKLAEVEESDVFRKLASQKLNPLDFI